MRVRAEEYADFAEYHLIAYQGASQINSGKPERVAIPEIINSYAVFIKEKPRSRFVASAKLSIATFLHILELISEAEANPTKNCDHKWREESNRWLPDVVLNNPHDQLFDFEKKTGWIQEKAGALALYYLGIWNNNGYFLKRLVWKYPESVFAKKVGEKPTTDIPIKRP